MLDTIEVGKKGSGEKSVAFQGYEEVRIKAEQQKESKDCEGRENEGDNRYNRKELQVKNMEKNESERE